MASTSKRRNNEKSAHEHRPTNSRRQEAEITRLQKAHLAKDIRRAWMDPRLLSRENIHLLQRTVGNRAVGRILARRRKQNELAYKSNITGLPDKLKSQAENLSGTSLDEVRVHYNSEKPGEIRALAYTQGADIHLSPGQERHLPHETWHAVQQGQGRVEPTIQTKDIAINVDAGLENEADVMGAKAKALPANSGISSDAGFKASHNNDAMPAEVSSSISSHISKKAGHPVIQAMWPFDGPSVFSWDFWSGGNREIPATVSPAPEEDKGKRQGPSLKELKKRADLESRRRGKEVRREREKKLAGLPGELRKRLIAAETLMTDAANTLPAEIKRPWIMDEPTAVESVIRPAVQNLPPRFPLEDEAVNAEEVTSKIERQANDYVEYCEAIARDLIEPCKYFTTYRENLGEDLVDSFNVNCRHIENHERQPSQIIKLFGEWLTKAQQETAISSEDLHAEMKVAPVDAERRVHRFFELGRLKIGHGKSFYASSHDAPAGQFGGEWALEAVDPQLSDVASKWVFHTHCEAVGDKTSHFYRGFTIKRGHGASHIKRKADQKASGVSITVDYQGEFNRLEGDQKMIDRFLKWVESPEGIGAIRKQKRN